MSRLPLGALLLALATSSAAQWPPSAETAERMRLLQERLRNAEVSPAQREAAREELSGLLKSPAGQARGRTADEKPARPARAAVDPYPGTAPATEVTTLTPVRPPPAQGVAQLEVTAPPKPVVIPQAGIVMNPGKAVIVDPRTGGVLHEIPGGYIDPRTGQVVPR